MEALNYFSPRASALNMPKMICHLLSRHEAQAADFHSLTGCLQIIIVISLLIRLARRTAVGKRGTQ